MKEKGFTLVELLGAITILAVISLLAFPPIIEQIRKSKDTLSGAFKEVVYSATDLYMDSKQNEYPKTEGNTYCIALQKLTDYNFLKEPLTDPKTGNKVPLEKLVEVKVSNGMYTYDMPDTCTEKKVVSLKTLIVNSPIVTTGSGLYKISDNEYRYRGGCNIQGSAGSYTCSDADPINNYVSINGQKYRIISVDSQGIKIMSEKRLSSYQIYDKGNVASASCTGATCPRNNANNTFCQVASGNYYGCSVYAAVSGNFTAGGKTGTVTQNSTLYDYLNTTGTDAEVINLRDKALSVTWNIGAVTEGSNVALSTITTQEKAATATFKLGLINTSDYINGSLDSNCQNDPLSYNTNSQACRNNNWLFDGTSSYPWTLNPWTNTAGYSNDVWSVSSSNGYLNYDSAYRSYGVRPVGYLSSDILIKSGDGTSANPWIILS